MNNENKKRKLIPIIIAAVLLLIALLFGLSKCSGLTGNSMTVYETQDNSLYIPTYDENESSVFTFLPAKDAQGDVTYELISAKDSEFKDVDYFTLLSNTDTQVLVAKGTPAGVYTLKIRAHATGDSTHKEADKDITYIYTIGKAASEYTTVPSAVEGLIYNGKDQALVHGGSSPYGTILYKVNDGEWSEELPTGLDAGVYTVFYKLAGDNNHEDIKEQSFLVSIGKKSTGYRPGSYSTGTTGITTSSSLSGLINYVKEKSENASNNKQAVSGKPGTYVEYVYDGNEHNNGYRAPSGITMVGDDRGIKAGTYIAIYTPDKNYCWSDGTRTPVQVKMVIKRKEFAKPTVNDVLVYNGEVQYADLVGFDEQAMNIIGNCGKNAGTYIAVVSLKDKQNYKWTDNTITDVKLEWHIFPKAIDIPNVTTTYVFKGGMKRVGSIVTEVKKYQTVNEEDFDSFDPDLMKIVRGNTHADAGNYDIEIALKDKHNYVWNDEKGGSDNRLVSWTIERKPIGDKPVDRTVAYNGCVQTNGYRKPDEVAVTGNYKGKEVGEYIATYTPYSNYCWSDDNSASPVDVILTITAAGIDKPEEYVETTYNGHVQTNGYNKPDGVDILPGGSDRGIDAGTYTAVYVPDANHTWSTGGNEPVTVTLKIKKARLDVPTIVGDSSFAYDGEKHHVEITGYNNNMMKMSGDFGSKKYVGDYSITISLRDKAKQNYEWDTGIEDDTSDKLLKWSITSNGVTVPTVNKEFVYNGKWQYVKEEDLDNFDRKLMKIVYKEDSKGKDAGDYKIWVDLKDKDGYYWEDGTTDEQELTWTINKAENPISVIESQVIVTSFSTDERTVFFVGATNAKGAVTYKLTSARKLDLRESVIDRFELDGTNIRIKGNTSDGIYYLTVNATAAGDNNFKDATKVINIVLTINGKYYTVQFDGNGADSGSMEKQNIIGAPIGAPLYNNEFVKEGYEFEKWTTNSDGTGGSFKNRQYVTYGDLTNYQDEGFVTLYAQWKLNNYTISYNNATVSDESARSFSIESSPFKLSKPEEKHGYDFVEWNTAEDGTGESFNTNERVSYEDLKPYISNGTVNLYAQWQGKRYTILLIDSKSESWLPISIDYATYGEPYGDVLKELYVEGYESGWYTLPEGTALEFLAQRVTSESIVDDSVISIAASVLDINIEDYGVNVIPLFARHMPYTNTPYTVNHYVQKLNSKEYEKEPFKTETRHGTTDNVIDYKEQQIKITGFHYASGSSVPRSNSPTVLADGSRIINIYYDRDIYTVSFNSRGGKDVASQEIPYQGLVAEPDLKERTDKEGNTYSLIGWYYDGKLFDFRNERVKGDMTLVAEWEKSVYVEAVSNNDKFGTAVGTGNYRNGETVTLRAFPEENHRFIMWEDGAGKEVSTDSEYSFTVTQEMIDAGTSMKFVAVFEEISSRSLALYEEMTFHADPGAEIGISDLYLSNLVRRYDASTEEDSPLSLKTEGIAFVDAYIEVAENAQPGTYVIDVTAYPRLLDPYHKTSTIRITVIVNDNLPIVTFDSKGGTDVSEQKVNENGHVARPADPYREGYVFMGWYLGDAEEPFDFDNMRIDSDITLIAKWGYRVRFDLNGGTSNPIEDQIVEAGAFATKPEDPVYEDPDESYYFATWTLDGEIFSFLNTPITRNITLVAEWTEDEFITVKVSVNDGNAGLAEGGGIYGINDTVKLFAKANRGYEFVGWYSDIDGEAESTENPWTFKAAESKPEYVAVFKEMVPLSIFRYKYREYNVDTNGELYQINLAENMIAENATLYGLSDVAAEYSFDDNHVSLEVQKGRQRIPFVGTVEYCKKATIKIAGDTPVGTYKMNVTATLIGDSYQEPITIVINVVDDLYTVKFNTNCESSIPDQEIGSGGFAMRPADPVREGYVFDNWYLDGETDPFTFVSRPITSEIASESNIVTLNANWLKAMTVEFDSGEGSDVDPQTVGEGRCATRPADPYLEGWQFFYWYSDDESTAFDFKTKIYSDTTLHAKWIKANVVSFNTNGGSDVASQTVLSGDYATRPADPTIGDGRLFDGWYLDGVPFNFATPIETDIELVAKWADVHTINLYYDGWYEGLKPDAIIWVKEGYPAPRPADPVRAGSRFDGWSIIVNGVYQGEFDGFGTEIDQDYDLCAEFTVRQDYTVYYDVKGVSLNPLENVMWNDYDLAPAENPSRLGYRFSGWYVDEGHTKPYTNQTYAELAYYDDSITSVTLYGSWFKIDLIDYKANMYSYEGAIGDDATFEIKDESRWYLVFDEYEIVGGNEDNVIRLTADKNHLVISDRALPGTYYVEVKAQPSSILKYFGLNIDLSDIEAIPQEVKDLLDEYSQTLLVEWTVLERSDEDLGTFDNGEDGGMGVYSTYSDGEDSYQGLFSAPGYYEDNTVIGESDEDDDNNTGDGNIVTEGGNIMQEEDPNNEVFFPNDDSGDDGTGTDNVEE